ncbi:eukaryotic translation initiation factor 4E-binding protein 3 isoform X1 [Meleagris gallopavo]|uniref:eukaryotic translation initiation factor 4E-binding protein 3 isoform X1 n=1 Tax=Meleagris gallopavo TaxID=9103 RepID=UPI000549AAC3|nr:eukaryotic translation initiation factor 4E-binding protein 3 isoform X1 [Meleagris gallopavo]
MGFSLVPAGNFTTVPNSAVALSIAECHSLRWARDRTVVHRKGGCQGTAVPDSPLLLAGTHIIYGRKFLLECKNSPGARTLPCCLPQIPGVTSLAQSSLVKLEEHKEQNESEEAMPDQDQFEMDN